MSGPSGPGAMRALVLHGVGDLRFEEVPRPGPGSGAVLIRVAFCGVCGSDLPRIFSKGTYRFPTICGHEFSGTVESCGEGTSDLRPGDRVTVFPLIGCGRCRACERGKTVQCTGYDYLGSRSDGAFAEYVVAPERNVLRLPEGVSLEEGAMTEPAAVALHALKRAGGCAPGDTVAIFGAGPIGLMALQWARAMGASQVITFDVVAEKLEIARRLGASEALDARQCDPAAAVHDLTGGQGASVTVEAAGVPAAFRAALEAARRGGRVVLLGNPSADVEIPAALISQVMRREVTLHGTWNSDYSHLSDDDDWHTTLRALASGALRLVPLVTHRVPLERAPEVLAAMRAAKELFAKVLVHP